MDPSKEPGKEMIDERLKQWMEDLRVPPQLPKNKPLGEDQGPAMDGVKITPKPAPAPAQAHEDAKYQVPRLQDPVQDPADAETASKKRKVDDATDTRAYPRNMVPDLLAKRGRGNEGTVRPTQDANRKIQDPAMNRYGIGVAPPNGPIERYYGDRGSINVTLLCGDKYEYAFHVHKEVLVAESEWFREVLFAKDIQNQAMTNQSETRHRVPLTGQDSNYVQKMLDFMYTSQYTCELVRPESVSAQPLLAHIKVYEIADKYSVGRLRREACTRFHQYFTAWISYRSIRGDARPDVLVQQVKEVVSRIYQVTCSNRNDDLRTVIVLTFCGAGRLSLWLKPIIEDLPEFGYELLLQMMSGFRADRIDQQMQITHVVQCPRCKHGLRKVVGPERGSCSACGLVVDWT